MKKRRTLLIALTVLSLCAFICGCGKKAAKEPFFQGAAVQDEKPKESRHVLLTHYRSEEHPLHRVALRIAETVEKGTNGRLVFDIYPNNALGGEENNIAAVADGKVEMRICGNAGATLDILSWLPSFHDITEAGLSRELKPGTPMYTLLCDEYERNGVHLLCVFEPSLQLITCVKKPEKLEDFRGLRIRITAEGEPTETAFWQAIGAEPVYYSLDTTYSAMQLGFIDAAENPLGVSGGELLKSGKYFYNLKNRFQLNAVYISNEFWETLTEEEKTLFNAAVSEAATEYSSQNPQIEGGDGKKEDELSAADYRLMKTLAGNTVRKTLTEKYGEAAVERIEAILFG